MPLRSVGRKKLTASAQSAIADLYTAIVMSMIGSRVDETGTLIHDGVTFYLRRDIGGRYELELHRTPVDEVEKRVRVLGTLVDANLVNADSIAPI